MYKIGLKSISACSTKYFELSNYLMQNANVVTNISYFQHKYIEVKSLRRSWRISNILLYKTLGWKLSVYFPNNLYLSRFIVLLYCKNVPDLLLFWQIADFWSTLFHKPARNLNLYGVYQKKHFYIPLQIDLVFSVGLWSLTRGSKISLILFVKWMQFKDIAVFCELT